MVTWTVQPHTCMYGHWCEHAWPQVDAQARADAAVAMAEMAAARTREGCHPHCAATVDMAAKKAAREARGSTASSPSAGTSTAAAHWSVWSRAAYRWQRSPVEPAAAAEFWRECLHNPQAYMRRSAVVSSGRHDAPFPPPPPLP